MTATSAPTDRVVNPEVCPEVGSLFISVIVPVRNEAAFIGPTLEALLTQEYPADRFEILVADGMSTDNTGAIVRDLQALHSNLRLLNNICLWSSAGRNVAIQEAQGDVVVVVDGHCELVDSGYLSRVADAFTRSGAACIGRPQPLDVSDATPVQRAIAAARASWLGHHPDSFIYSEREGWVRPQSVAVAYRREVFDQVGLFDESFDACEDVEFNHRVDSAGLKCFFTPSIGVRYYPRTSLSGLFAQMVRYGRGRVRLLRKHADTFSFGCFVPAAWVLGVVLGPLLGVVSPVCLALYGGVLAVYSLIVGLVSAEIALRDRNARSFFWVAAVFATIHFGAGIGILQEWLAGTGRRLDATAKRRSLSALTIRAVVPRREGSHL